MNDTVTEPRTVAWDDRPRCGRLTRTGDPCAAVVRHSVPLDEFAPACAKHLTASEQRRLADEPLWSPVEQVHWALGRLSGDGQPLPAHRIAGLLKLQQPAVVECLHRLVEEGRAATTTTNRCRLWGTPESVRRWTARGEELKRLEALAAEREAACEARRLRLHSIAQRLGEICDGHDIAITPASAPGRPAIVLTLTEPDAAHWLLSKVEGPGTAGT